MIKKKVTIKGKTYHYDVWQVSEYVVKKIIKKWNKREIYEYFKGRGLKPIPEYEFDDDTTFTIKLDTSVKKERIKMLLNEVKKLTEELEDE